jgi:hypothetical protein
MFYSTNHTFYYSYVAQQKGEVVQQKIEFHFSIKQHPKFHFTNFVLYTLFSLLGTWVEQVQLKAQPLNNNKL